MRALISIGKGRRVERVGGHDEKRGGLTTPLAANAPANHLHLKVSQVKPPPDPESQRGVTPSSQAMV